jgi:hypothetical protein
LDDLVEPFRSNAKAFIHEIEGAGASVTISATYRPVERAYLMHWAWAIARDGFSPANVPPMLGVPIVWDHAVAKTAAEMMALGYGMAHQAALTSRHTQRLAVDMTVHWAGTIHVKDAHGVAHAVSTQQDLWPIGASFGVHKLPSDPPHWSNDGH